MSIKPHILYQVSKQGKKWREELGVQEKFAVEEKKLILNKVMTEG